jgi:hypothetical protein
MARILTIGNVELHREAYLPMINTCDSLVVGILLTNILQVVRFTRDCSDNVPYQPAPSDITGEGDTTI